MKVLTSKGLTKFLYFTIKKKQGQKKIFMAQQGKRFWELYQKGDNENLKKCAYCMYKICIFYIQDINSSVISITLASPRVYKTLLNDTLSN